MNRYGVRTLKNRKGSFALAILGAFFAIIIGFGISAQTQLFSENFEDGNADGWTKSSGTWSVVTDGTLQLTASDSEFTSGIIGGATFFASASFDDFLVTSLSGGGGTPPPPPTGLTAAPGNAQVTLNWSASSGATSYNVK